jgi:hypothetical protein
MRYVSNSELQTFKECRRRWYLQYVRKLVRIREDPIGPAHLGTRVHEALALYYQHLNVATPESIINFHDQLVTADLNRFPDREQEISKEAELSRIMLEGYFPWLEESGADEGLEVVGAEQELQFEILPGIVLQGKIDIRVRRVVDGARKVLDHKTVMNFVEPIAYLPLDEQHRTYLLLEKLLDIDEARIDGVIWNMLRKVKRSATAKPPFYDRTEISVNDFVLRDFYDRVCAELLELVALEDRILNGDLSSVFPHATRDCRWKCPFFGVCPTMDDESKDSEGLIKILFEVGDPYERYNGTPGTI